jgi:tetratricopeptide (TPR) repeat protein
MRLDPYPLDVAHLIAGDYEMAASILRERILLVPEIDMSRAYLSAALGNLGHHDEARQLWSELMRINPAYSFADRIDASNAVTDQSEKNGRGRLNAFANVPKS